MPLSPKQTEWLFAFSKDIDWFGDDLSLDEELEKYQQIEKSSLAENQEKQKQLILIQVRAEVQKISTDVKNAFSRVLTLEESKMIEGAKAKSVGVLNSDDGLAEFDFFEDIGSLSKTAIDQMNPIFSKATADLSHIEFRMRAQEDLFSDKEISDELYTPLVQQRILPETFVADKFSEVQKMIDRTNQLYMDELAVMKPSPLDKANLGLAKDLIGAAGDAVKGAVGIAYQLEALPPDAKGLATAITDLVTTGCTAGIDACEQLHEGNVKLAIQLVFRDMASAVGGMIKDGSGDAKAGKYVELCMKGAASALKIDPNKPLEENIGIGLKDALMLGLSTAATATDSTSDENKALDYIISGLQASISSGAALSKAIKYAASAPSPIDWKDVMACALDGVIAATNVALAGVKTKAIHDKEAELAKEEDASEQATEQNAQEVSTLTDQAEIDAQNKAATDAANKSERTQDSISGDIDDLKGISVGISDKDMKEAFEKMKASEKILADEMSAAMDDQIAREQQAFTERMDLLYNMDDLNGEDAELKGIAQLIADLEKDRQLWEQVEMIASKGAEIAKVLLEALGPGPVLIELAKSITLAYLRGQDVLDWASNRDDAAVIPNPYLSSIENFLQNQQKLLTHQLLQTGLLIVKLIGEITAVTPAATVGKAVSAGADIGLAAEKAIFSVYNHIQLKKAWKETKIALAHPEYRRHNLYVRKLNPTLAKYTIAYGATEANDPIARSAMNKIGLTNEMLEDPDAGVKMVTQYLETRYNEDIVVKQAFIAEDDWVHKLPPFTLNIKRWLYIISQATIQDSKFMPEDGALKVGIQKLEELEAAYIQESSLEPAKMYLAALEQNHTTFIGYSPKNSTGKPFVQMITAVDEYLGYLDAEKSNMTNVVSVLQKKLEMEE